MKYVMKSGFLYREQAAFPLAEIKSSFAGPIKRIFLQNGDLALKADIRCCDENRKYSGDVRSREYILTDRQNRTVAAARPYYNEKEEPCTAGWPVCRIPWVDHARVAVGRSDYLLTMHNNQNYSMKDLYGIEILRIMHRGISGGWSMTDDVGFDAAVLCGLFVFCRYIEQENEFLIV